MIKNNYIKIISFVFIGLVTQNGFTGINTWTLSTNIPGYAIAVSASNPQIIYFSGGDALLNYKQLYRSMDGGNTWSMVTDLGYLIRSIAIDPVNNNNIYLGIQGLQVLKSTDGASSFYSSSSGLISSGYPIFINPSYNNILYTGGFLSKSTDFAQSWLTMTTDIQIGVRAISFDALNTLNLFCATDYYVYKVDSDDTVSWTSGRKV